jgi:hypothetical protein
MPSPKAIVRVQSTPSPKAADRGQAVERANTMLAALTDHQRAALVAIASGQSFSAAARSAGNSRQTIYDGGRTARGLLPRSTPGNPPPAPRLTIDWSALAISRSTR